MKTESNHLSDLQVDLILQQVSAACRVCKIAKEKQEILLPTVRSTLLGLRVENNVCPHCMGTGKNENRD